MKEHNNPRWDSNWYINIGHHKHGQDIRVTVSIKYVRMFLASTIILVLVEAKINATFHNNHGVPLY